MGRDPRALGGWMVRTLPTKKATVHPSSLGDTGWFDGFSDPVGARRPTSRFFLGAYKAMVHGRTAHAAEDSCQAYIDLGARHFVGMHWGTFDLSDDPSTMARDLLNGSTRNLDPDRIHLLSHGGVLGVTPGRAQVDATGR